MRKTILYFSKILTILTLSLVWLGTANAATQLAAFAGGVRPGAVWTDAHFFAMVNQCHTEHPCNAAPNEQNNACVVATHQCIASKMQAKGAASQAIAFAQYSYVPGAIDKFKKYGKVAVAHARLQMADASDGFFIINEQGLVVPIANPRVIKDPHYQTFLKQFPKAFIVGGPGNLTWPKVSSAADNVHQFIFSFPMVNGCMACARVGAAQVAYLFDHNGNFVGTRLLEITTISEK
jgi:hypothetical protein